MTETDDSRTILDRARKGDRAAFDVLAEGAREPLLGWLRGQLKGPLGRKLEPEEVLQEAFLLAFRSADAFQGDDESTFRRWVQGIARNILRNASRRQGWKREIHLDRDVVAREASPSRQARRKDRFERLARSVESLSDDHRTVIRLARIEGLRIREVAERMGRSEDAVKSLLLRAMRQLRESFGDTESFSLPEQRLEERGGADGP